MPMEEKFFNFLIYISKEINEFGIALQRLAFDIRSWVANQKINKKKPGES
jgi:hypothetical protein